MAIERITGVSGLSPLNRAYIEPRDRKVNEVENTRFRNEFPRLGEEYNPRDKPKPKKDNPYKKPVIPEIPIVRFYGLDVRV